MIDGVGGGHLFLLWERKREAGLDITSSDENKNRKKEKNLLKLL